MYNLVSRIQDGLGELKKLLETHIHNQGLAAIEKCGEAALNASIPSKQIGATFILEDIKCFLIKLPVCLFSLSLIEFVRTWQFSDVGIRLKTKLASLCFYSLSFGVFGVFFLFSFGLGGLWGFLFWFGFEGEGEFPSEVVLSVRMSCCLESWLCTYNTQHLNNTPGSPLFQEA